MKISWFDDGDIACFPAVERALTEPDGLLAIGGNLSATTLQQAYEHGIFPWFDDDQPIMWWSPSLRAVLDVDGVHIGKNMKKLLKQERYSVSVDRHFAAVAAACATLGNKRQATWITADMQRAYCDLHALGMAHSIEVWNADKQLVGGLYGVFVKNCFCGESMFSYESNTSKLALISLAAFLKAHNCQMIDCQLPTEHLSSMGAIEMPRSVFVELLANMPFNELLAHRSWGHLWQRW